MQRHTIEQPQIERGQQPAQSRALKLGDVFDQHRLTLLPAPHQGAGFLLRELDLELFQQKLALGVGRGVVATGRCRCFPAAGLIPG